MSQTRVRLSITHKPTKQIIPSFNPIQPGDATFLTGSRNFSQVIVSVLIYHNQP
jgi:hypothetical protein